MTRLILCLCAIGALAAACGSKNEATPPAPSGAPKPEDLVTGMLPDAPETELARGRCVICHDEKYLVQQRLSPEGWKKTVAKMRKFGAPVTDEEEARLATWLAGLYTQELPMREEALVALPAAGMPAPQ